MSKRYLEAIRALPDHWVSAQTRIHIFGQRIVAANPHKPAIIYEGGATGWREMAVGNALEALTKGCDVAVHDGKRMTSPI